MFEVIKNKVKLVEAYQLGSNHEIISKLIEEGKIKNVGNGTYEIFSQETLRGNFKGELAKDGDYIKVDGSGYPYPNSKAFFDANHRHLTGNTYEQIPIPLKAWDAECGMCPEIQFLIDHKGLQINTDSFKERYSAPLWGTIETASADVVIIFYSLSYNENGEITDADFNFVARGEFEQTYSII